MSSVIVKFKDKVWKAKGVTFHHDHMYGRVALLIRLGNNHKRFIFPAGYLQEVDDDGNFVLKVHEGELFHPMRIESILKIIDDNNIEYANNVVI